MMMMMLYEVKRLKVLCSCALLIGTEISDIEWTLFIMALYLGKTRVDHTDVNDIKAILSTYGLVT